MLTKNYQFFWTRFIWITVLLVGLAGTAPARPALAAALTVTNTSDDGAGSLRQAIASAGSGDTIRFSTLLSGQTIILFSQLEINKNLTIDGSTLLSKISVSGNSSVPVMQVDAGALVTLKNIKIVDGFTYSTDGGGLLNLGTATIENSVFFGNTARHGGGINNAGTLSINNSTILGNSATADGGGKGGGILNSGTLNITNSTFSGNSTNLDGLGGGILNSGTLKMVNSTFFGNTANEGGGLNNIGGVASITNSTFSNNTASSNHGGGIRNISGTLNMFNTIVANSFGIDCDGTGGTTGTMKNNLLRSSLDCYPIFVSNDPQLGPLTDNGGSTQTMALLPGSQAINNGDAASCPATDQRGVARPQGPGCDIGAYEVGYLSIAGNAGVGGVILKYGYRQFTTADANGNYTFHVPPAWTGRVIPSKLGYTFNPPWKEYTNVASNISAQNYSATAVTYTFPGRSGDTWRASVPNGGGEADDDSIDTSISADGRYVAFSSTASNLTAEDTDYVRDIFVHDNQTGKNELVSVHTDGAKFTANSFQPVISADGRYVAFLSYEWYYTGVIYLHDRYSGTTEPLPFSGGSYFGSYLPSISADGRYISYSDNGPLVDGDTNNKYDVFVYDQYIADWSRVSLSSSGAQGDGDSSFSSLSADGRYVVFQSDATNLVSDDTNGVTDIFLHDCQTGATTRISSNSSGAQADGASLSPSISGDGRYVAFQSSATDLVGDDTNGVDDVFVKDLQTGVTMRVSRSSTGTQANQASDQARISADGNYVAFRSSATNLVSNDTNGVADIFLYDRELSNTTRVSVASDGAQANDASPSIYSLHYGISGNGHYVAFASDATNLVPNDTNDWVDVFVHANTCWDINVNIGNAQAGSYCLPYGNVQSKSYAGIQDGPVKIKSAEKDKFITSQRVISGNSFNEVMGYPTNQLTTEYWFPWYDNISMSTWVLVGNASSTQSATVSIYVGTARYNYTIPANGRITPRFNLQTGPVRVVSTNGVKIFTSERVSSNGVFNEVMGYPAIQFTTDYWFPWYDNLSMNTWILVGNPTTSTAKVAIYIGGAKKYSASIPAGGRVTPRFNLMAGPVRVVSTNGVKIFTSERAQADGSFNEVMGYPASQLATEYWYPWYDNVSMATWVLVGNPTGSTAAVDIYIGGVKLTSTTIGAGKEKSLRYPGLNAGPVRVVSTNGIKIFSSERVQYGPSFNEMMGYPGNQLTTEYWFPWYDSTSMSTDILVGRP